MENIIHNAYGIGPEKLAQIWIEREIKERTNPHGLSTGTSTIIAIMRREMQEACGLVQPPNHGQRSR